MPRGADAAEKPVEKKAAKFQGAAAIAQGRSSSYVPEFEDITEPKQRLIWASSAKPKRGKNTFGFTMPKPLAFLQLDLSYESALKQARKRYCPVCKKAPGAPPKHDCAIRHISYSADPRGDLRANNAALFERFTKDFDYVVDNYRSVLVDTGTELMDVRKMAEFGRTTQIQQIYYGSVYKDFNWMVGRALNANANVGFLHRSKDEWKAGESTGEQILDGWRGIVYDAQVYLTHDRDEDNKFNTTIVECSQRAELMGMVLSGEDDENNFATLAGRVFTNSEEGDWE